MGKTHRLRYSDLGKSEFSGLTGAIEVVLTNRQAELLRRFTRAAVDSTEGMRSQLRYLISHIRIQVTYPRLFWLGEYYDPEELESARFDAVGTDHVRLLFQKEPSVTWPRGEAYFEE